MAIVGAGPIGLATPLTAQSYSPAEIIIVNLLDANRLEGYRYGRIRLHGMCGGRALFEGAPAPQPHIQVHKRAENVLAPRPITA